MQNKGILKSVLVTEDIFLMTPSAWPSTLDVAEGSSMTWKISRQPSFLISFCKIKLGKVWVTKLWLRPISRFLRLTRVLQRTCVMWVPTADLSVCGTRLMEDCLHNASQMKKLLTCQYASYFIARDEPSWSRGGCSSEDGVTGPHTSIVATFTT